MTVYQLKQLLNGYPDNFEVLMELNGQKDIFVIFNETISGKYHAFPEGEFSGIVGEIDSKDIRKNAVGLILKREER